MVTFKSEQAQHSILFILGNGFDLNLNMKTRYSDIYETYIKTPSKSDIIKKFKEDLSGKQPYEKWADFEMGMAKYAEELSCENDLIECVRDFKTHMVSHLSKENNRFKKIMDSIQIGTILSELENSLFYFYSGLTPNVVNQITNLFPQSGLNITNFSYLTFNYTNSLEELLKTKHIYNEVYPNLPLHIHGTLDRDVVLGIDNLEQISTKYQLSRKGKRAFIKTIFNEQYDSARVEKAKQMISKSSVICTYGFSMGKSDDTWVFEISKWLLANKSHHLIVYQHDVAYYSMWNSDERMDVEEERKYSILQRLGILDEDILEQIHIPIGHKIFDFDLNCQEQQPFNPIETYA